MLFPYAPVTGVAEEGDGDRNVPRTTKMRMPIISTRRFLGSKTAKILLSSSFFLVDGLRSRGSTSQKKGGGRGRQKLSPAEQPFLLLLLLLLVHSFVRGNVSPFHPTDTEAAQQHSSSALNLSCPLHLSPSTTGGKSRSKGKKIYVYVVQGRKIKWDT